MLRKLTSTRFHTPLYHPILQNRVLINNIENIWLSILLVNHRRKRKNLNFRNAKCLTFILQCHPARHDSCAKRHAIKQRPYTLNLPNYPIHFAVESNRRGSSNQKSPFVLCPYKARTILGSEVGRRPSLRRVGELGSVNSKL